MSKDFKSENPAMAFISKKSQDMEEKHLKVDEEKPPKGYKMDPKYVETKSKRVGILIQPSVFERLKEFAYEKRISVNEAINEAVRQYIETER